MGHMMAGIADSIMVGWVSSVQLAASSLANHIYIVFMLLGIGMCTGLTPLVSKAFGQNNEKRIKRLFKHGVFINTLFGIVLSIVMALSSFAIPHLNQPQAVVDFAIPFFLLLCISVIPYMIFLSFKQFLEGIQYTKPGMVVIVSANLLNILLNYIFIFGNWGAPALGIMGAGISTLISRTLMPIMLWLYMASHIQLKKYILNNPNWWLYSKKMLKEIIAIGYPIGLQSSIEVAAFSVGTIMVGWLGSNSLAAHQVAMNLSALVYLMASGLSTAATIRISHLIGKRKYFAMHQVAYSSYIMVILFMLCTMIISILARNIIPSWYLHEVDVIKIASTLIIIGALYQIFDGFQVVSLGILRGMEDVKIPTFISLLSYWIISIPISYVLGFVFKLGANGVWIGNMMGLFIASVLLFIRFKRQSNRLMKQFKNV